MIRFNKRIFILISIIVLIPVLFFPYMLFKLYDKKLLSNTYTEKIMDIYPIKPNNFNTKNRLGLICRYGSMDNVVFTDKNQGENSKEEDQLNSTLSEIDKMKQIEAFPNIDLNNKNIKLTYSNIQTYTDLTSSEKHVKLNYNTFSYKDGVIKILKDNETNKIYQYEIINTQPFNMLDISNIVKNLSEYLDISLINLSFKGESPLRFETEDHEVRYQIYKTENSLSVNISQ